LIDKHSNALSKEKNIYAGITRTRHGVAFIGIGLVRPMVGPLQVSGDMRRYLVITRHLNSQILSDLGATFQIDHLNYTPNKVNEMSMPLNSSAGSFWAISTGRRVFRGAGGDSGIVRHHANRNPGGRPDLAVYSGE
jgi:hypothetical protein